MTVQQINERGAAFAISNYPRVGMGSGIIWSNAHIGGRVGLFARNLNDPALLSDRHVAASVLRARFLARLGPLRHGAHIKMLPFVIDLCALPGLHMPLIYGV